MQHVLVFWYIHGSQMLYRSFVRVIQDVEGRLAVVSTARNIHKPLFQDYTLAGRFVGFFLRLVRIGIGLFIYAFLCLGYLFIYFFWLALPFLFVLSILGGIFGPSPLPDLNIIG